MIHYPCQQPVQLLTGAFFIIDTGREKYASIFTGDPVGSRNRCTVYYPDGMEQP